MPVVIMIIVGVVVCAVVIAGIWYVLARGSQVETITEEEFTETYDGLVRKGEIAEDDRAADWQDFRAWQVRNEEERRSWEEGAAE